MRSGLWVLRSKPHGYWKEVANQREYLLGIVEKEKLEGPDRLTAQLVKSHKGSALFRHYKDFRSAIVSIFPEVKQDCIRKPRNYWKSEENQRVFMSQLERKHNLTNLKDWKTISTQQFINEGGQGILQHCGSILEALRVVHPPSSPFWNDSDDSKFPRNYFKHPSRRRNRIDEIATLEDIETPIDWIRRNKSMAQIQKHAGGTAICKYYEDLLDLLNDLYPEVAWNVSLLGPKVYKFQSFWKNEENQRKFIETLAEENNKARRHWHRISRKSVIAAGGKWILDKYSTVFDALVYLYADRIEPTWKRMHRGEKETQLCKQTQEIRELLDIYDNQNVQIPLDIQKKVLQLIAARFCVKEREDWENISIKDMIALGAKPLLVQYHTLGDALSQIMQEDTWKHVSREIIRKPNLYFDEDCNIRSWFDGIARHYNFSSVEQIVDLTTKQIRDNGGSRILQRFSSLPKALETVYPEIEWNFESIKKPRNYWHSKENQRQFMERFARQNDITSIDDWYGVKQRDFVAAGGASIMKQYSGLYEALTCLFPEVEWKHSGRQNTPASHWKNRDNVLAFLKTVEEAYYVKEQKDWYRISRKQILSLGGSGLLHVYGTILNMLRFAFPEKKWDTRSMKRMKRSQQRMIFVFIQQLIPEEEIVEDYVHMEVNRKSNFSLEFDIYVPRYEIAFEYQGEHHFKDIPALGGLDLYQERDNEKAKLCARFGITLVCIPYWITMTAANLYAYLINQDIPKISNILVDPQKKE